MKILLLLLLIFINIPLQAQFEKFLVLTQYQYDLNYGISQFHRTAINQKTYDTTKVLLREVEYISTTDTNKSKIGSITYYFYDKNNLKSVERYLPDATLIDASEYIYNKKNLVKEKKKYILSDKNLVLIQNTKYKYKADSLVLYKTYNVDKKLVKIVTITRMPENRIIEKTFTDYAAAMSQDSLLAIKKTQTFNDMKLMEETILYTKKDGLTDTVKTTYNYNENNTLSEVTTYKNSQYVNRKTYEHYSDNAVKSVTTFNAEKKRTAFTAWERKKVEIIFGGLESVF